MLFHPKINNLDSVIRQIIKKQRAVHQSHHFQMHDFCGGWELHDITSLTVMIAILVFLTVLLPPD